MGPREWLSKGTRKLESEGRETSCDFRRSRMAKFCGHEIRTKGSASLAQPKRAFKFEDRDEEVGVERRETCRRPRLPVHLLKRSEKVDWVPPSVSAKC